MEFLKIGDACLNLEHTSCGVMMWMRCIGHLNCWMLTDITNWISTTCLKDVRKSTKGRYWQHLVPCILWQWPQRVDAINEDSFFFFQLLILGSNMACHKIDLKLNFNVCHSILKMWASVISGQQFATWLKALNQWRVEKLYSGWQLCIDESTSSYRGKDGNLLWWSADADTKVILQLEIQEALGWIVLWQ